jgi:adenylate cyclase
MELARPLIGALIVLFGLWAVVSLAEAWPLDNPLPREQLDGWQLGLAAAGIALYGIAAAGYFRLYRRRRARFLLAVTLAFALLADAMLVIAWATNWRLSWWEWHVLMLLAVALVAAGARAEWHEERFTALYLDETLAGCKDVSILFADLAGFTPFSERSSPDEVATMLNAYFGRLVPLLEDRGAEVHQLVGDEIMAVFNKQSDQPDHAMLAARSGLELQSAAGEIAAAHPNWPRFRVGVNSGEVLAGVVGAHRGHRKHGVVGDTVNLAARLQAEAPVGSVLVGGETLRRLPAGTLVERLPELRVKGKEAPVEAHVLRGLPD